MGRETRRRIVEVSARLFRERGYDGTSVARVLAECGVNSGSLYHFFDSKEELAQAVIERCIDRLPRRLLDPAEESTTDVLGRVMALLGLIREALDSGQGVDGALVGLLAAELGSRRPPIRASAVRYQRMLSDRVRAWFDEAGPRLPSVVDRSGLADFVATVIDGGLARARAAGSPDPFDAGAAQLEQYLVLLADIAARERSGEAPRVHETPEGPRSFEPSGEWRSW